MTGTPYAEIMRSPNRAGMCTAVIPKRTSLDMPIGKFDGMTGMYRCRPGSWPLLSLPYSVACSLRNGSSPVRAKSQKFLLRLIPKTASRVWSWGAFCSPRRSNPRHRHADGRNIGDQPACSGRLAPGNERSVAHERPHRQAWHRHHECQVDFPIQEAQTLLARARRPRTRCHRHLQGAYGNKTVSSTIARSRVRRANALTAESSCSTRM